MERERAAWHMALYRSSMDLKHEGKGQGELAETQTRMSSKRWHGTDSKLTH